jgi:para-nitrobenzyl esterase
MSERIAVDYAGSLGVKGDGAAALEQLRALPPEKLVEGVSGPETLAALSAGTVPPGMAMSIIDGQFLIEAPEAALAARRQAMVPVIIGANDRDLALGSANSKDELFAIFGPGAERARSLFLCRRSRAAH